MEITIEINKKDIESIKKNNKLKDNEVISFVLGAAKAVLYNSPFGSLKLTVKKA